MNYWHIAVIIEVFGITEHREYIEKVFVNGGL